MVSIWTVWRVYPERGRVRIGDWTGEELAREEFDRQLRLAGLACSGLVELRCDGRLLEVQSMEYAHQLVVLTGLEVSRA